MLSPFGAENLDFAIAKHSIACCIATVSTELHPPAIAEVENCCSNSTLKTSANWLDSVQVMRDSDCYGKLTVEKTAAFTIPPDLLTMPTDLDAVLADVDLTEPWSLVNAFSTLPRWKPEDVNGAGELIADRLRSLGVQVNVYEPELYLSIPYEASVLYQGRSFRAKPPSYSTSVPDGVIAQLTHVPATYSASLTTMFSSNSSVASIGREAIGGKIVLTEGYGLPSKIAELESAGAVGVITVNPGEDIHWAICTSIWGTPGLNELSRKPGIPVLSVNRSDGQLLAEAAKRGERVEIRTKLDEGWFPQRIVVAEIPGSSEPESFVLLHGHYDSWDVGVGDNATGDATLLEIARVLWKQRENLSRSVRIAWWPGHSTGRYAGSTWYADTFATELNDYCVAQVNCDSPGCRWATEYYDLSWMPETSAFVQSVIQEVAGLPSVGERAPRAGDWSFNNIGISGFFMLSSTMPEALRKEKNYYTVGGCGGSIAWHTENDTIEVADKENMLRDIRVYLAAVWRLANADVLPFDWRATTAEFGSTLDRYQKAAAQHFDLGPSGKALARLNRALDSFYAGVKEGSIPKSVANKTIRDLARILVPIDHAREVRFAHDPALPVLPLPALGLAASIPSLAPEMIGFAVTDLRRGQNQVVDAFHRAAATVDRALPNNK